MMVKIDVAEFEFFKKFNMDFLGPKVDGRWLSPARRFADAFCLAGLNGENREAERDAIGKFLCLLIPNIMEQKEIPTLWAMRKEGHPLREYGLLIHRILERWDSLVTKK